MTTKLRALLEQHLAERLDENIDGFAKAILESASGKANASVSIKAQLSNGKLYLKVKLGYGPRYGSEGESCADVEDPKQPNLIK